MKRILLTLLAPVGILSVSAAPGDAPPTTRDRASAVAEKFRGSRASEEREIGGVKLRWCPPGRFRMGSPRSEPERRPDEAQVEVTLTKGFWMGKFEVTQGDWKRI